MWGFSDMIIKIATKDLVPGMKVVDLDLPGQADPFLYAKEGVLRTRKEVDQVLVEGYLDAYIDTVAPESGDLEEEIEESIPPQEQASPYKNRLPPKVALEKELPAARALFDHSVHFARDALTGLCQGNELPLEAGNAIVDAIFNSITRNYNAWLGLVKLRRRDEYTYTHCINVCVLALLLSAQLGNDESITKKVGLAGLFHDIGKVFIPEEILNKNGPLTSEEFMVMKKHPELGCQYVKRYNLPDEIVSGIRDHHEKLNGKGYPRGLMGAEISETARLISIADIYDALTSRRVYKDPMLPHQALCLMYSMCGDELDEQLFAAFIHSQGIYPVGSVVELSSGWRGVVLQINPNKPLCPQVALIRSPLGHFRMGEVVDLSAQSQVKITKVMTPVEAGVDPALVFPGCNTPPIQQYVSS